jgi:hypothetical protein
MYHQFEKLVHLIELNRLVFSPLVWTRHFMHIYSTRNQILYLIVCSVLQIAINL